MAIDGDRDAEGLTLRVLRGFEIVKENERSRLLGNRFLPVARFDPGPLRHEADFSDDGIFRDGQIVRETPLAGGRRVIAGDHPIQVPLLLPEFRIPRRRRKRATATIAEIALNVRLIGASKEEALSDDLLFSRT